MTHRVGQDAKASRTRIRAYLAIAGCIVGFASIHFIGTDVYFGYRMRLRPPTERMVSHGELAFLYYGLIVGVPAILLGVIGLLAAEDAWPLVAQRIRRAGSLLSPRSHPALAAFAGGALATVAIVATRLYVYHQQVVTNDEYYYRFDAMLLRSRRLFLSIPPILGQFFPSFQAVFRNGRYFSKYFIGHSAILALGRTIGLGWWIVPLLSIAALLPFACFVRSAFGQRAAAMTLLLLGVSPLYFLMGATTLSQPTVIFFFSCFLALWIAYRAGVPSGAPWLAAFGMGAAAGLMGMTRPMSAIGLLAPILFAEGLERIRRRSAGFLRDFAVFLVPALVAILILMKINMARSGSFFTTAYSQQGFRLDRLMTFTHSDDWRRFFENAAITFGRLNWSEFGWPVSLVFIPWAFGSKVARILGASALTFFVAGHLTPSPGIDPVGPEHFAELAPLLALFTALGILRLLESADRRAAAIRWGLALLTAYELFVFLPHRLTSLDRYVRQANRVKLMASRAGLRSAVVFANRIPYPWLSAPAAADGSRSFSWPLRKGEPEFNREFLRERMQDTGAGFAEYGDDNLPVPDPDLRDEVIFFTDFGPADALAMDLLPGRRAFALVLASPDRLEIRPLFRTPDGVRIAAQAIASASAWGPDLGKS